MNRVTIILPIYKPDSVFLRQQLDSLNRQTYNELELLVWNDCPSEEIDKVLFEESITRFPVTFFDEKKNLGYVGAFGELCKRASGDYISFCDQDDIWEYDKISECMEAMLKNHASAVVCDRALMDTDGVVFCPSVKAISKRSVDIWKTGDDITTRAAFFSYCTGMTLIAERKQVQRCLPFVPVLPHDQQLAFLLSGAGPIIYVEKPLVRHRRTGKNASGTLAGVKKKQDYYDTRCKPITALLDRYEQLYPNDSRISEMRKCCAARINGNIFGLWKYRNMIPDLYIYEIGLALCPDFLFRLLKKFVI